MTGSHENYALDKTAQDLLFRDARTANTFSDEPVGEEQVAAIYDLIKYAPTAFNSQPLRILTLMVVNIGKPGADPGSPAARASTRTRSSPRSDPSPQRSSVSRRPRLAASHNTATGQLRPLLDFDTWLAGDGSARIQALLDATAR